MRRSLLLILAFIAVHFSFAQPRCGNELHTTQIFGLQRVVRPKTKPRLKALRSKATSSKSTQNDTLFIPVVFHVIFHDEESNLDFDIPLEESRFQQQLDSLNKDFARQNADTINTPDHFLEVVGKTNIQFVFAKQDPQGRPTTGIVRVQTPTQQFTLSERDRTRISNTSNWPSDQYLNIWVADFDVTSLGYAQFPISNAPGLEFEHRFSSNPKTDGVFMNYRYIGNNYVEDTDFNSVGRTLTHEIGHWLGLFHNFEGGCSITGDFIDDTPSQSSPHTNQCPADSSTDNSCAEEPAMFQNFMDYTQDVCMNLFTAMQVDRIDYVLSNTPRRKNILSSSGLNSPETFEVDLGIIASVSPQFIKCNNDFIPEITLINYGTTVITSFEVSLFINGELSETILINDENEEFTPIASFENYNLTFSELSSSTPTTELTYEIVSVNSDGKDDNATNDTFQKTSVTTDALSFNEDINTTFENNSFDSWIHINPNDNNNSWTTALAPNENTENSAAVLNYFGSSAAGTQDYLISPVIDLSEASSFSLSFDYAYSKIEQISTDGLMVMVSTDCGATFDYENIIWERWSSQLDPIESNEADFSPIGPGDWNNVTISLYNFLEEDEVVIAFVGFNGGGNNIYLDNIATNITYYNYDLSISSIENLPLTSCTESINSRVMIRNNGGETINSFILSTIIDSDTTTTTYDGLSLEKGAAFSISLRLEELDEDVTQINLQVNRPNGLFDENFSNNTRAIATTYNEVTDIVPFKVNFTNSFSYQDWSLIDRDQETSLEIYRPRDFRQRSLMFPYYSIEQLNKESWFISPILDLSEVDSASMKFKVSYAFNGLRDDRLQVLASDNCGNTYDYNFYDKKDDELKTKSTSAEWFPESDDDWREEVVDLSILAGESRVRIAFKGIGQNGNNIFVDDIEFFNTATPPIDIDEPIAVFPNPVRDEVNVLLNFNNRDDVTISIVSMSGQVMFEELMPNSLNQTYTIKNLDLSNGLYVLRISGSQTSQSRRIMILK